VLLSCASSTTTWCSGASIWSHGGGHVQGGGVVFRHDDVDIIPSKGFAELCLDEPAVDRDDDF
jgi:hypothetical protein